ncbi:Gentisate 1,2-dioxygenase [Providencia alcalifaciens]|nr:Gentisate 1,2-dioxygenase [Providencia alcalifaciens]
MTTQSHEQYRENIAGRADVADTPELLAYYKQLDELKTGALWTVANKIEPWQPKSQSVPVLWRYQDLREHVLRSVDLVTPEKAGRRVIYLNNPGRQDVAAAVGWLYSGLQVMHPGEAASAHAHSSSALRFIMEGRGAYTIVEGQKMILEANDFVLTPNGTWHEHGVEEGGLPCIWQDGLDIPLVNAMEAGFYKFTQIYIKHKPAQLIIPLGCGGQRHYVRTMWDGISLIRHCLNTSGGPLTKRYSEPQK